MVAVRFEFGFVMTIASGYTLKSRAVCGALDWRVRFDGELGGASLATAGSSSGSAATTTGGQAVIGEPIHASNLPRGTRI
jgi:hypothetical protein